MWRSRWLRSLLGGCGLVVVCAVLTLSCAVMPGLGAKRHAASHRKPAKSSHKRPPRRPRAAARRPQHGRQAKASHRRPARTKTAYNLLPPYKSGLSGSYEVRVRNPNGFPVAVGVRLRNAGKNFTVESKGVASVYVPNGHYNIYFVYSSDPKALYKGDSFDLNDNGVEIQIVQVVNGNYGIRRVN